MRTVTQTLWPHKPGVGTLQFEATSSSRAGDGSTSIGVALDGLWGLTTEDCRNRTSIPADLHATQPIACEKVRACTRHL